MPRSSFSRVSVSDVAGWNNTHSPGRREIAPPPGEHPEGSTLFCCSGHRLRRYARIAYEITILAGARTQELVQQKREPVLRPDKRQNHGSQHEDDSKISSSCSTTRPLALQNRRRPAAWHAWRASFAVL